MSDTAPSDWLGGDWLDTAAHERWLLSRSRAQPTMVWAAGIAIVVHVLLVAMSIVGWDRLGAPSAQSDEGIAVEIVEQPTDDPSKASHVGQTAPNEGAGTPMPASPPPQAASAEAQQQAPPAPPQPQPLQTPSTAEPAQEPKPPQPEKSAETSTAAPLLSTLLDTAFQVPKESTLKLEAAQPPSVGRAIVTAPPRQPDPLVSQAERYIERRNRAGKAHFGVADTFTRDIYQIIERIKPVSPGPGGQSKVEFVIDPKGDIQDLQLTQSSGSAVLDKLVMTALRNQRHYAVPPETASLRDRTFEITLNYR